MIYIFIIYTPNLGLRITAFVREREQGRFRGSSKEARGRSEGASKEHGGAPKEHGGAPGEQRGVIREYKAVLWGSAGAQQVGAGIGRPDTRL